MQGMATDWYEIIDHKDPARLGVSATTVTVLQGLCPRFREEDRAIIFTSIDEKILFPDAKNWKQRNKIRDRICHVPRTIPSFEIFLTQCEVLRLGAPILQDLLSGRPWKEPLFPAFSAWAVQIEANDESGRFSHRAVYCQLWLFVIRKLFAGNFLPALLRQDLAALASKLGCEKIARQIGHQETGHLHIIHDCFRELFPVPYYTMQPYDEIRVIRLIAQRIAQATSSASPIGEIHSSYDCVRQIDRPRTSYDFAGVEHLYFTNVYPEFRMDVSENPLPRRLRDFFRAFFGCAEQFNSPGSLEVIDKPPMHTETASSFIQDKTANMNGFLAETETVTQEGFDHVTTEENQSVVGAHSLKNCLPIPRGEVSESTSMRCNEDQYHAIGSAKEDIRTYSAPHDEMMDVESNNIATQSYNEDKAVGNLGTRQPGQRKLPSISMALHSYTIEYKPQNQYEVQRTNDEVPEWNDLPFVESVDYGGGVFRLRNLVNVKVEGATENDVAYLEEIREIADGHKLTLISWCYSWDEASRRDCKNIGLWPAESSYMVSNHLQVISWDSINSKFGQEGCDTVAETVKLEITRKRCRVVKWKP